MTERIKNILSQPYPFYYQGKGLWIIAGLLFLMTFFFSYAFEPFVVYTPEHKMDYLWISFIHACSPGLVIGLFALFNKSSEYEEKWNVFREILLIASFLLMVGILQFLIRDIIYNNPNNWSWRYLYEEIRNTFLVGTLFAILLTSLNFNRLNAKNTKKARAFNVSDDLVRPVPVNATVYIETQVKANDFELQTDTLLFAKADGNYVELFFEGGKNTKVLKRITLKELEEILKPYPNIIRTHRSYLVNLNHVSRVIGNAQGYKLRLNDFDQKIPVSRYMIRNFNEAMTLVSGKNKM